MSGFFCLSGSPADAAFRSNSVDHFSIPSTSVMHVSTSPNLSPLSLVRESQIDGASDDSAMSELSNISEFISQDTPDSISLHQGKFIVEKSFKLLILPAISFLSIFM